MQLADDRKATTYGLGITRIGGRIQTVSAALHANAPPEDPLLIPRGGGGSRTTYRQDYWTWPLPPAGKLTFAAEWPNAGVDLALETIDADVLRDAASRARELWPTP